jgi:hypothetical protein
MASHTDHPCCSSPRRVRQFRRPRYRTHVVYWIQGAGTLKIAGPHQAPCHVPVYLLQRSCRACQPDFPTDLVSNVELRCARLLRLEFFTCNILPHVLTTTNDLNVVLSTEFRQPKCQRHLPDRLLETVVLRLNEAVWVGMFCRLFVMQHRRLFTKS